ncbi:hypothetical protein [Phenylobacterium sp.]|uniref:hypothetical protein n=1 Tax=Phenylobacterium sp. TaxID=1871053 RepID=UPI002811BE10|nr:hypothetical protein [Phenylobacterium sp.]
MADYRLYFLDEANHIRGVAELDCEDDAAAVVQSESHTDAGRMELWRRDQLIRRFERRAESV